MNWVSTTKLPQPWKEVVCITKDKEYYLARCCDESGKRVWRETMEQGELFDVVYWQNRPPLPKDMML